jgi:hypothetical protein
MTINRLLLFLLIALSMVFALGGVTFADDTALRRLSTMRVTTNVPDNSGPLLFQLQNTLELNLRKAGFKVSSESTTELRLNVIWLDIDPQQKEILGKYGTVQLSLHEPVKLARDSRVTTLACTWQGLVAYLHGPPDTFADRTRQWASDLTDDFLNRWSKANTIIKNRRD